MNLNGYLYELTIGKRVSHIKAPTIERAVELAEIVMRKNPKKKGILRDTMGVICEFINGEVVR